MIRTTGVAGKYFDGASARAHRVTVRLDARDGVQGLVIDGAGDAPLFWPLEALREVGDQARDEGIVLHPVGQSAARLVLPHGEAEAVIRAVAPKLSRREVSRTMWRRLALWGGGAVASVVLILFAIIPALSDTLATMIPPERERALGRQALNQIGRFLGGEGSEAMTCTRPDGHAALQKMVARLTREHHAGQPLDVRVFRHPMVNAFAVPGGHVVLFEGLIAAAESPEEVAGVLAHEIGHVAHRDPTRLALRTAGSVGILGMVFGDFAGGALALVLAQRLMAADYTQAAEAAADAFAHEMLGAAGLPTLPFANFFLRLRAEHGDTEGLLSHLASHPDLASRAERAQAADRIGPEGFEPVLTQAEWAALRAICR